MPHKILKLYQLAQSRYFGLKSISGGNTIMQDLMTEDGALCTQFDVIKMKHLYGKKVLGIERSTFLINKTQKLQPEWCKIKFGGHVEEVLIAVKGLNKLS